MDDLMFIDQAMIPPFAPCFPKLWQIQSSFLVASVLFCRHQRILLLKGFSVPAFRAPSEVLRPHLCM